MYIDANAYKLNLRPQPEAYISVNKGRQKVNLNNKIYLNNAVEFEIELFNSTSQPVLAKISLNGKLISQTGLIIKPGQRHFLDRFIDVDKKFKFDTYEVESFEGVEKAIEKNGEIEISFYNEKHIVQNNFWANDNIYYSNNDWNIGNSSLSGNFKLTSSNTTGIVSSFTTSQANPTLTSSMSNVLRSTKSMESPKVETGRIEQGGKSNQKFTSVNMDFESYPIKIWKYQLLPNSQKPKEIAEIVKNYCRDCRSKLKPKFKFCPVCGTKV
jgi:hypothetical protein